MSTASEQLAALIDRKHTCLVQLRDLGVLQAQLVGEGEMGELLKVLAAKQQVIDLLQQVERALEPFGRQDPEQRQWRSAEERARCARQSAACQALLVEVLKQEKASESQLILRRDEAARRLQGAHSATHARQAYNQIAGPAASMLDLSSDAGGVR